jgi:hypothetical protein
MQTSASDLHCTYSDSAERAVKAVAKGLEGGIEGLRAYLDTQVHLAGVG